jgi:hypothetical protein
MNNNVDFLFGGVSQMHSRLKITRVINGYAGKLLLIFLLLSAIYCSIEWSSAQSVKQTWQGLPGKALAEPNVMTTKINESIYKKLLNSTLAQYNEDLNYSSNILDDFIKENITGREAMVATVSLSVLASQTVDGFRSSNPDKNYSNSYNNTILAFSSLRGYLWNISKFYETEKTAYAIKARESFNSSLKYYEKARVEK